MRGFGERLKQRADQLGLSGAEVARRLAITTDRYNKYENNRNEPDLETLVRIAEVLEVTAGQLLAMEPIPGLDGSDADGRQRNRAELDACLQKMNDDELSFVVRMVKYGWMLKKESG